MAEHGFFFTIKESLKTQVSVSKQTTCASDDAQSVMRAHKDSKVYSVPQM